MLSSKFIQERLPQYGERVLDCVVFISRGIHDNPNQRVLESTCALLNSGGGLLQMHNAEHAGKVQSKDLDTWWSGMESNLADILSGDDLCNYFDFVGNYDDPTLFLFVKTAEHLCTLTYHCRLPTDTATHTITYTSAAKLLAKTGDPTPLSALPAVPEEFRYGETEATLKQEGKQVQFKLLASGQGQGKGQGQSFANRIRHYSSKYVSAFANHQGGHVYFGIDDTTAAVMGEALEQSVESRAVQQVERMMRDMIWGDAGVRVERGKHWDIHFYPIANCPRNERRRVVVVSVCKFPGGVFSACPDSYVVNLEGKVAPLGFTEWKAEILNQARAWVELHTRFVKVSLHTPFSRLVYALPHTLQAAREKVFKLSPGNSLQPPGYLDTLDDSRLVSAIRHLESTFANEPHLTLGLQCWGSHLHTPTHPDLRASLFIISQHYGLHLALVVTSHLNSGELWGVGRGVGVEVRRRLVQWGGCVDRLPIRLHLLSLGDPLMLQNFQAAIDSPIYPPTYSLSAAKLDNVVTSLLISVASYLPCQASQSHPTPKTPAPASPGGCHFVLTCDQLSLLWTRQFTRELWVHGPPGAGKTVAALELVRELGQRGCRRSEILYLAENPLLCSYINSFKLCLVASRRELMADSTKPGRFRARYGDVRNVIVDEAQNFKDRDGDWYALAERLSRQTADSMVLADGGDCSQLNTSSAALADRGKVWEQEASEGSRVQVQKAEPVGLAGDTSSIDNSAQAQVTSDKSQTPSSVNSSPAPAKRSRLPAASLTSGYFWVFMDYAQKVHKFGAGLPGLIGKNNFMLSEISRNSKEIFDYAMTFMQTPSAGVKPGQTCVTDAPVLGHDYGSGRGVEVVRCDKDAVHRTLFSVLESCLGSGVSPGDIAVLVSKRREKDAVEREVKVNLGDKGLDVPDQGEGQTAAMTVDTVRGFSGLDRPVVIGLDPHTDSEHADLDKFMVNLATRAKDGLVIITTSDDLMAKLRTQ